MSEILVIAAHPQLHHSRVNAALMAAAQRAAPGRVDVCDLYAAYPDYFIDVPREQERLSRARLVVWQHPVHWYSMPALMKLWLDEVFSFGWAYGPGGTALRGKDLWLALSTGGAAESYQPNGHNRHFFDAFLPPYEQTAALAGLRLLPPLVLHGAHRVSEAELADHAAVFAERLRSYPSWPELAEIESDAACVVPADARPMPAA
ncbi:MAG: NAD(P)H-dependent oxidoreductase [Rubrivivax sp.]|nr:NAD(P)H-dependent oxidoreductase [Rubrivivax sp.]